MELFTKLFGNLLVFVYHCFDRIVVHGYLSGLSRPEQVVHFFRQVVGAPVVSKELLSQRTADYQRWVDAFALNHDIAIEWAEKGVRKEDHVLPWLRKMVRKDAYGVYFIFKSMEQGPSFRITVPKFPTKDPNYRILARQKSRFTHDYFYIRDEVLGPFVMRVATFFPFQTTYYLNGHSFIEQELNRAKIAFKKNDNAFLAVDDVEALQAAADKLSPATPTASRPKAWRSPSCSSSFTNGCADHSPTAASTINPMRHTDPKAGSRRPTIVPTPRFRRSLIC
jgi:hypothetical protein